MIAAASGYLRWLKARPRFSALAALWLTALSACAGASSRGPEIRILPRTPGATTYETSAPPGPGTQGDLQGLVEAAFNQPRPESRGPETTNLVPDPRLAELARFAAEHWALHGGLPPHAALDFIAHHLGLPEPSPHLTLIQVPRSELSAAIAQRLASLDGSEGYTHVGCFASSEGQLGARAVLVLSSRPLEMQSIARTVPRGSPVSLRGSLLSGYHDATLVVDAPDGSSDRRSIGLHHTFAHTFSPPVAGTYRMELLAEGRHGLAVVANFPLYVGVPAADRVVVQLQAAHAEQDAEAIASELARKANLAREQAGLAPLEIDEALSAVADAHNQDMLTHHFIGHSSPTTGTALERVEAAGIVSGVVLENIGQAYSAEELHRGWMDSPGHRRNILDPHVTHLGVAVHVTPTAAGPPQILSTVLFIRRVPPLPSNAAQQVKALINRRRTARGLPPLQVDSYLDSLCQRAATRHFERPALSMTDNIQMLHQAHQQSKGDYRMLNATMRVTTVLEVVADEPGLLDPNARGLGVGLSQGQRPGDVPNAIAAVIVLGY